MKNTVFCITAFCMTILLSSCTSFYPESKPLPQITMEHMEKIPVNVSNVEFIDYSNDFSLELTPMVNDAVVANSDYGLEGKLRRNIKDYAHKRFAAASHKDALHLILKDIVIERDFIESDNKIKKYIEIGKKENITVTLKIWLRNISEDGFEKRGSELSIRRYVTFTSSASLAERDQYMFNLLDGLLRDLDKAVLKSLKYSFYLIDNYPFIPNVNDIQQNISEQSHKDFIR